MENDNIILTDSFFVFCIDVTNGMSYRLEQSKKEIITILEEYAEQVSAGEFTGDGSRNFQSRVVKFKFMLFDDKTVEQSEIFDLDDNTKPWLNYLDSIEIKSQSNAADVANVIYRATLEVNKECGGNPRYLYNRFNLAVRGAVVVFANSEMISRSSESDGASLWDLINTEWINNGPEGVTLRSGSRKILFLRSYDKEITVQCSCRLLHEAVTGESYHGYSLSECFINALYWCD